MSTLHLRALNALLPMVLVCAASAGLPGTVQLQARLISGQDPVLGGQVANGERFGRAVTGVGDVDGDGIPDIAVGSRSDQDGGPDAGAVYIVFMNRDLSPRSAVKIGAKSGGLPTGTIREGDMFGYGVAGIGDIDGDGIPDLAVTACNAEPAAAPANANEGALHVCLLRRDGTVRETNRIDRMDGMPLSTGDSLGQSCASLGDLDGDGYVEIGIGATGDDAGGFNRGALHVVEVGPLGQLREWRRFSSATHPSLLPIDDIDNFGGRGVARLGDLDRDGSVEIAVGCYRDDDGGTDRGAVWILSLRPGAAGLALERTAKISSSAGGLEGPIANEDLFGMTVAPLGDLDGDGTPDVAVGNNKSDVGGTDTGTLFLLGLGAQGTVRDQCVISRNSGFPGLTLIPGERFGRALANVGDIRGDGSQVLAVGAGAGVAGGRLWLLAVGRARTADINGDGSVNALDLAAVLSGWSQPGDADVDWSGRVDALDLARVLSAWTGP